MSFAMHMQEAEVVAPFAFTLWHETPNGWMRSISTLLAVVENDRGYWSVSESVRGMKTRVISCGWATGAAAMAKADAIILRVLAAQRSFRAPIPFAHVEVFTDEYERSHGHRPSGRGSWVFAIGCSTGDVMSPNMLWLPVMNYGEAKKIAVALAAAVGVCVVEACS